MPQADAHHRVVVLQPPEIRDSRLKHLRVCRVARSIRDEDAVRAELPDRLSGRSKGIWSTLNRFLSSLTMLALSPQSRRATVFASLIILMISFVLTIETRFDSSGCFNSRTLSRKTFGPRSDAPFIVPEVLMRRITERVSMPQIPGHRSHAEAARYPSPNLDGWMRAPLP